VNSDLVPALVAAGGGSALMGSIWGYEHKREADMRASRVRLALRFPAGVDSLRAKAVLHTLSGLPDEVELLFETSAGGDGITFFLWVPASVRASVVSVLASAMPGLRASEAPVSGGRATLSLKVHLPNPSTLSTDDPEAAARTLLGGLSGLAPKGERVVIRWAARPSRAPGLNPTEPPTPKERATQQAWRQKTQLAGGFQLSGLVLVRADRAARARELAEHVASAIRSRRGAVGGPRISSERGNRSLAALPRVTRSSGWLNAAETLPLLAWPLGNELIAGVEVGATRELPVPRPVAREGRRLFVGSDSGGERPVAISAESAKHHLLVAGSSGSGKSTLLAGAVLADIASGAGGAVIDPKADLVAAILDRVRPEDAERIVVIDPGDASRPVPGVALLAGGDPDLRAEVLTGALRSAFPAEAWGVRTDYYLRLAIRTLAETPEATLADVGRLFVEEPFLQTALARLGDPFLVSAWQGYLGLSAGARFEQIQAPMNRVMALLNRPHIRAVIASPAPKLDVADLLEQRKWLLISLAPGVLGESGAAIVGSALMYVIWSAIEARVTLQPAKRHPIFLYLDELATLTGGTPFSFELLAERARGLGAGLTVAVQTIGRIPEPTRGALLGNVASFITFRAPAEEAQRVARQLPGLSDTDVMSLGRFEVAARVATEAGSAVAVVTGHTEPLPPPTGQADAIRDRSATLYGSDPTPVAPPSTDPRPPQEDGPVGRQRRRP
jgi:hypothetical protein